jgi:gas vesicle protein GvpG
MGLITGILTLPLAPVRGVAWVAEQLVDAADRELHDPAVVRAQLAALNNEFEMGYLSEREFEEEEEKLLDRLEERLSDRRIDQRWPDHG